MRKTNIRGDSRYRFWMLKDRNIEVIFSHLPKKRFSTGTRDIAEAVVFAEDFLKRNGIVGKKSPTFAEFSKDFFTSKNKDSFYMRDVLFGRKRREEWYTQSQRNLELYVIPTFGKYPINAINIVSIENWLISFDGHQKKSLASDTRKKVLISFRYVLDDAVRSGYIEQNPARFVKPPSYPSSIERRALTLYEQQILFPDDIEERIKIWDSNLAISVYFSIMYDTGFRPSEILGLLVGDVYSTPKGLAIYTTHSFDSHTQKLVARVKTSGKGMETRVGLLSPVTEKMLLLLFNEFPDSAKQTESPIFRNNIKSLSYKIITCSEVNKIFKKICARFGITDLTQYCLRHTYATYRRGNLNENSLALAMGHTKVVRDDYDHRTASMLIAQLENEREKLFDVKKDSKIKKLYEK